MPGLTQAERLTRITQRLSDRDQHVVLAVTKLRFVSTGQLARLFFTDIAGPRTRIRQAQRTVERLAELELLHRLERRMGGVRAGSSGYVCTPTREGLRVASFLRGDDLPSSSQVLEPGTAFVDHALAASELFVQLVEADRETRLAVIEHQGEPECWRQAHGRLGLIHLRPDAFLSVGVGELELRWFVEIDLGTEGSRTLRRKLQIYITYYQSQAEQQAHGVFPRVLWAARHARRVELLERLVAEMPPGQQRLFQVTSLTSAIETITGGDS